MDENPYEPPKTPIKKAKTTSDEKLIPTWLVVLFLSVLIVPSLYIAFLVFCSFPLKVFFRL